MYAGREAGRIYKEDLCFCGNPLVAEYAVMGQEVDDTVVLIESGKMVPTDRDPNFLRFLPDWKAPSSDWEEPGNRDSVVVRAAHFECFYDSFNQQDIVWKPAPGPNECHMLDKHMRPCKHDFFGKDPRAYRYTVGTLDKDSFIPDEELPHKGVIGITCTSCTIRMATKPGDVVEKHNLGKQYVLL